MSYNSTRFTEECPLTKDGSSKYKLSFYCGDGLKFIISCFAILTIAITTTLILQLLYTDNTPQGKNGIHGAVASDYTNCSQIGTKILWKGGNAVDAAIAATICMMVVAPYKTGLGGGGSIMIYNHKERTLPIIVDFANNTIEGAFAKSGIRIPAVLKGLQHAHNLKGKLPWKEVIEPSVVLAKEGFVVSKEFASELSKNNEALYGHLNAGDVLKLPKLADTLHVIAYYGADALYNGTLSDQVLGSEVQSLKHLQQLANYKPVLYRTKQSTFYNHTVYYPPHALSVKAVITALDDLNIPAEYASSIQTQVLVAKALIHLTTIPPSSVQNAEEERYAGVVAMDWEDTYVCILTGLSAPMGSRYMTEAGFLLDKTDSNNNLTTFNPIIFHNKNVTCGLRGIFGTDDAFVVGQLLYNIIVRGLNISSAIEYPRYYLLSDGFAIETDEKHTVDNFIRNELNSTLISHTNANLILKSVNAILKRKDLMASHSDSRGGGLSSRF